MEHIITITTADGQTLQLFWDGNGVVQEEGDEPTDAAAMADVAAEIAFDAVIDFVAAKQEEAK